MYNINVKRGDTWSGLTVNVSENSVAIDLTNASIKSQLKKSACDNTAVYEFSTDNQLLQITDAENGQFIFAPQIIDLESKSYYYDCELTKADGTIITIFEGKFTVNNDITQ